MTCSKLVEVRDKHGWCKRPSLQIRSVCLSAHLDSFCMILDKHADLEFVYETKDPGSMRRMVGWQETASYKSSMIDAEANLRAKSCDILVEMLREMDLMETRTDAGLTTVYIGERWLKPLVLKWIRLPAILRLLVPSYFHMARRFVRLMDNPKFWVLPIGVHAVRDFVRLYNLMHGDLRCIFRSPKVEIRHELGGEVNGFPRVKVWGYFVEKQRSDCPVRLPLDGRTLKILWCGRMLGWKRVDVLIKAFMKLRPNLNVALLIVGEGPEKANLKKLAGNLGEERLEWLSGKISFHGYLPNSKVRELMHEADVYIMPSNAEEGWGAIVSEALAEGCPVISTWEAGSSATLLSANRLYHANSPKELVDRVLAFDGKPENYNCESWNGVAGANKFMGLIEVREVV